MIIAFTAMAMRCCLAGVCDSRCLGKKLRLTVVAALKEFFCYDSPLESAGSDLDI